MRLLTVNDAEPPDRMSPPKPPRPESATVPRVFRPLPEGASIEQILHSYQEMAAAYATIAAAFAAKFPQMVERQDEFEFIQRGHERRLGELEVWRAKVETTSLPPMRAESASVNEIVEHLSQTVAARVEAEHANPSTPPPDAAKVASISKEVMAAAIMQLKAAQWDKLEAERKAAEDDRRALQAVADRLAIKNASDAKRARRKVWVAAVLGGLAVLGAALEHFVGAH